MAAGIALVPEDRRQQGLVMDLSIERNATLTRRRALSRFGLLLGGSERRSAREWTARLQTKYALHLREDGLLVGVLETEDLAAAQAAMDRTDVNRHWQTEMAPFFSDLDGTAPDRGM